MTPTQIEVFIAIASAIGGLMVSVAVLVWFMAEQFKKNREAFWKGLTELHNSLVTQIDAHEKEDDRRFERLNDLIWRIQVRNADKDDIIRPPRPIGDGT